MGRIFILLFGVIGIASLAGSGCTDCTSTAECAGFAICRDGECVDESTGISLDTDPDPDSDLPPDTDSDSGQEDTEVVIPPDHTLTFVRIDGGSFTMGDSSQSSSSPEHLVQVASFDITRTEVTAGQYSLCVSAGECTAPATSGSDSNFGVPGRQSHPMNYVDHTQASEFCAWALGSLPSEAQWEYAARSGGSDVIYPWGDSTPSCDTVAGAGCTEDYLKSDPVCSHPDGNTSDDLCDMAGNVYEWMADVWAPDYGDAYDDDRPYVPPPGSILHLETFPIRGGGYTLDPPTNANLPTFARRGWSGDSPQPDLGFRCVREVADADPPADTDTF